MDLSPVHQIPRILARSDIYPGLDSNTHSARGLPVRALEGAPHSLRITKAGFHGDRIEGEPALRNEQVGGVEPQLFHGTGRRKARLLAAHPDKLSGAETRGVRKLFNRQGRAQVGSGMAQRDLDPIGLTLPQ